MDAAGRLVLPKAVRERAQLSPGVPIEVRVVDGHVELVAAALPQHEHHLATVADLSRRMAAG